MLFSILYDLALLLLALLAIPKMLYQWLFHKKYRESLPQRFGISFPKVEKGASKLVWVHAVSVGEAKAVSTVVRMIKTQHPDTLVITSSVTETGFAEAARSMPEADYHVFLPLDFMWVVGPIIKRVKPDLVLLCETDFWLNFLKCCKEQGAATMLVNGKLSQRSLSRYQTLSWFAKRLFPLIDTYCVQNEHYKQRFEKLGIAEDKIKVTGNIKFDDRYPAMPREDILEWKEKLGISSKDHVIVAGSTHTPEEKLILDALDHVWNKSPSTSLILVPRHPERFDEVAALLESRGIPYNRYSQLHKKMKGIRVVLIDGMGLLRQCYQLADIAIVAGSFTAKVGGHNIVEPLWYGVPVIYGPHMHSQPELVELVERFQAGLQAAPEELPVMLQELLEDPDERERLGRAGLAMTSQLQGAAEKTYKEILKEIE